MARRKGGSADPLESTIEAALRPGRFVGRGARHEFIDDLDKLAERLAVLIGKEPKRAAALHETFIAGCYEKANEIDDSGRMFGEFVGSLFAGWVTARQAADADADETALRLLAWMDDDPYGLANELDRHVAKVLDKAGAAAFERLVRARMTGREQTGARAEGNPEGIRHWWGRVLRTLFRERRNLKGYISVCEESEVTATDCAEIAKMLAARRKLNEALEWVDRGLALKGSRFGQTGMHDLAEMKRGLLRKIGRGDEALELAWEAYAANPSWIYYEDLMRFVPRSVRKAWHQKAMDAAEGADLGAALEIFLDAKEVERLIGRLRRAKNQELDILVHSIAEPVAAKIAKSHPDLAARLYRSLAVSILKAKRNKAYGAALSHLEAACRAYERAGLEAEWEKLVAEIRSEHRLKTGIMPKFEALLRGDRPSVRPTFLERAKAKWARTE